MSSLGITTFGAVAVIFMAVMYELSVATPDLFSPLRSGASYQASTVSWQAPGHLVSWK